ncbi:hypothetical protein KY285_021504 [Solanum tuberosum]|nr:hypothetical protein KY289_021768 [Solanum tuberosum]KAH0694407.1 hypothetical protein KY285_021504 [Solanum tuberosum]
MTRQLAPNILWSRTTLCMFCTKHDTSTTERIAIGHVYQVADERQVALLFPFPGLLVLTCRGLGNILNLKERCTSLESLYFPLEEVPIGVQWNEFMNPAMEAFQCINRKAARVDACVSRRWKSSSKT